MTDMTKYDEFAKRMEATYPDMLSEPYGGFAIGEGWWPIVESLLKNIYSYFKLNNKLVEKHPEDFDLLEPVKVAQIKEKFGGLRFYYQGGDEHISGMVTMAEAWAGRSCEHCGNKGERRSGGWIRTLCDEHEAELQRKKHD